MSERRRVLVVVSAVFVLLAAVVWIGPLTRDRAAVGSTAAPLPVDEPAFIEVEPGEELCATNILLGPESEVAELHQRQRGEPLPPREVVAKGPWFESPVVEVPGGRDGAHRIVADLQPPDREMIGELCVRNAGDEDARLLGTTELRTYTRMQTMLDDDPVEADLSLAFYAGEPVSALGRLGTIVDRAASLRGFLGSPVVVWLLLLAVAVGVPLLVLRALSGALREG